MSRLHSLHFTLEVLICRLSLDAVKVLPHVVESEPHKALEDTVDEKEVEEEGRFAHEVHKREIVELKFGEVGEQLRPQSVQERGISRTRGEVAEPQKPVIHQIIARLQLAPVQPRQHPVQRRAVNPAHHAHLRQHIF